MRLATLLGKIAELWEATQVELQGRYSVERIRGFIEYSQRTSMIRALVVMAIMPWPCVFITIVVDLMPLHSPSEGTNVNYFIRTFLAFWVGTTAMTLQFRHSVPSVSLSNAQILVNSTVTSALSTIAVYGLVLVVGFPLPFTFLTASPVWVAFMVLPLVSFLRKARANPEVWLQVVNTLKTWVGQESFALVYPAYFYLFTTVPIHAKTPFAMLLPVIKLLMRNVMAQTVKHLNDEIPEVVLMNVEVFNSLFMSYCMQNTPSIWTTLGLIVVDGAQMLVSMHDISVVIQRLRFLKEGVNSEHDRVTLDNPTSTAVIGLHRKTILVYTEDILNRYQSPQPSKAINTPISTSEPSLSKVVRQETKVKPESLKKVPKSIVYSPSERARSKIGNRFSLRKVFIGRDGDTVEGRVDVTHLELEYTAQVRKVLYITEFMLLINYVEVIVPIIFSANLVVMYHLPNRVYYSQIASMDDVHLWKTIENVMLYGFLQIVSLVLLFIMLWQKLHISGMHQLAFVLEKQGEQIQTKLIFWVFYNVQISLQHYASDYTFNFAWLHKHTD